MNKALFLRHNIFIKLSKKVKIIFFRKKHKKQLDLSAKIPAQNDDEQRVPDDISQCEALLKSIFGKSPDIIIRRFETRKGDAIIFFVDGLVSNDLVDRDMLTPMKSDEFNGDVLSILNVPCKEYEKISEVISNVLSGCTAIFYKNSGKAVVADLRMWSMRSVEIPDSEAVIRGPKEGFNENLRTNTSLLRRKIKNPKLIIENMTLGTQTNTFISLVYIEGIVNLRVLEELKGRLAKIDSDAILESGYIEQFIEESPFSPVPRAGLTQKPDVLAARILEGRVGIMCDGTPHVLTVPHLFVENIQTSEDYYSRTLLGSFMRMIRVTAIFISVLLPGLYVAITTFHQEMIPVVFLNTIITSVEQTPLPVGAEVFFLILMFELLRESGTRLPKAVGSAISIVGALIIGDAAVSAGIVSSPVVIVVALAAVCSFIVTSLNEFITLYRLVFLLLGGLMGLIGIATGVMFMITQVVSTESFGIPITDSFSKEERKDAFLRFPLTQMKFRPQSIVGKNWRRQK